MARQEDKKLSAIVVLIFEISLSKTLIQTVQLAHSKKCLVSYFLLPMMMLNNSLHYAGFLLGEIFHCRLHWNLTTSSVAGGGCFTGIMAFPFLFPFGVHVQFMERFHVCVYIKTISLIKLFTQNYLFVTRQKCIAKSGTCTIVLFVFFLAPFHITLYNRYWGT